MQENSVTCQRDSCHSRRNCHGLVSFAVTNPYGYNWSTNQTCPFFPFFSFSSSSQERRDLSFSSSSILLLFFVRELSVSLHPFINRYPISIYAFLPFTVSSSSCPSSSFLILFSYFDAMISGYGIRTQFISLFFFFIDSMPDVVGCCPSVRLKYPIFLGLDVL